MKNSRPSCIKCGSTNIIVGGHCSFHYKNGGWIYQRGSAEIADGSPLHCQNCGTTMLGNLEPPFDLELDKIRFR